MCFEAILDFWRVLREGFLEGVRSIWSWITQAFNAEPVHTIHAPSEAPTELTQLVEPQPQVEDALSDSSDSSIDVIPRTSTSLCDIFSVFNKNKATDQKSGGAGKYPKKIVKDLDGRDIVLAQKSHSDPGISLPVKNKNSGTTKDNPGPSPKGRRNKGKPNKKGESCISCIDEIESFFELKNIKEPEPKPGPSGEKSRKNQDYDSSESTTISPYEIVETPIIHREDVPSDPEDLNKEQKSGSPSKDISEKTINNSIEDLSTVQRQIDEGNQILLEIERFLSQERRFGETSSEPRIPVEQNITDEQNQGVFDRVGVYKELSPEPPTAEDSIEHKNQLSEAEKELASETGPHTTSAEHSSDPAAVEAAQALEENAPLLSSELVAPAGKESILEAEQALEENTPLLSSDSVAPVAKEPILESEPLISFKSISADNNSVGPPLASEEESLEASSPFKASFPHLESDQSLNSFLESVDPATTWNSEEFRNNLYENQSVIEAHKRRQRYQESQNTSKDVNSDIFDSDSLKLEERDDLSEASSSHLLEKPTDSPILVENPQNSTSERTEPPEISRSSELGDIHFSSTEEESQPLLGPDIVGEEIQEEERYIAGNPEVENEAHADSLRRNIQCFKREPDYNKFQTSSQIFIDCEQSNFSEIPCDSHPKSHKMPVKVTQSGERLMKQELTETQYHRQIRVLTLNKPGFQEHTLYRLEKNWVIEFRLGPTLFGRKISIHCNYPSEDRSFHRDTYQLLEWKRDEGCENSDDTATYAQILCKIAGNFHFYFTDDERKEEANILGSGFFLVDPTIWYGQQENLPLDCIQCQTVISKQLGSFSSWSNKLRVTKESGYNMVHFTPIQELGDSNSAYSLKDQLKINPAFKTGEGASPTWEDLKSFIRKMNSEWKVASICDIVLNHTANESPWIQEHPEATYNCANCMYMRPAYLLDGTLKQFSRDVKNGLYETKGIPAVVDSWDHLNAIRYHLLEGVLKEVKIHELYTCDVNKYVSLFLNLSRQNAHQEESLAGAELKLIQDPEYKRLESSIDLNLALKIYNIYRPGCFDEDTRLRKSCEEFKQKLDSLNKAVTDKVQDHLNAAVDNILGGIEYWRVKHNGPRLKEITKEEPLIPTYFTDYGNPKNIKEYEEIMFGDNSKYLMAHNGWIIDADPLVNFAGPQSDVYIRRELIPWGDSVKLRFGEKPSDSPYLWEHMRKYVELTASIFDGVRLDNCHSTPIHVAQYLLDCARNVRPDLYVVAELFTNSDEKDNIFVNSLGISSLIREAMNSSNSHEQGRLVHRFGGIPVGSFYQPNRRPIVPSIAHALFLDLTHDNPSPIKKTSVFNLLTTSALVNMACCGTGSNRGYDELVPNQISVVDETREYTEWSTRNDDKESSKYVSAESGIIAAKKALNDLHYKLGSNGYNQVYVDQMDPDVVAVTRHCPITHQSYIMVAFTAFNHPGENEYKFQRSIRPLIVEGILDEIVMEATLSHTGLSNGGSKYAGSQCFEENDNYINGYSEYKLSMKQNIPLVESEILEKNASNNPNEIVLNFKNFKPGSVVVIKVSLPETISKVITDLRCLMNSLSSTENNELKVLIQELSFNDLNRVLYRCDQEERDEGKGFDTYEIPDSGKLVYSGFQGFISLLSKIRPNNDLGHPMCENLRRGDWMIEYISDRLKIDKGTKELGVWIENHTKGLKGLPRYLKPAYFDMLFTGIYIILIEHSFSSLSSFVNKGSTFVKSLAMGSIQFAAFVKSADLPQLSPNLTPPRPPTAVDENGKEIQACVSLSAGLPHFSVGYMRNWGRDTFIALRGLFILTARYQEARYHILGYGACLRHGLIPNLLDGGRRPRFNCRDAVWWWLYCIKCYVEEVPNGIQILEDKVSRIFPTDESEPQQPGETEQTLQDVMQEALNRHFQGVTFRERNAGREIDEHMTDNGFNNHVGVHPETGFVFGGNKDNCGTWMDKMGSSQKAANKGKPATPRDGSACEIVGLSKAVVSWLGILHDKKKYKYEGVERKHPNGKITKWSFKYWGDKIQTNFEKYYWVSEIPTEGEIRPDLINKRGIYKDCYGATQEWTDFQLRCNFPIVMVVAPELFNSNHAWTALQLVEKHLVGPLGMKTLDSSDWAYRGDYDNSNDSSDPTVAHGFNYHQGPEWLWPIGYYFRAKLYFAARNNKLKETIAEIKYKLSNHFTELQTSDWKGLPELTNSNGAYCHDSSRTQAWSMSSILEVLYDLQRVESAL